jgi:formate dehydrogenase major subunit
LDARELGGGEWHEFENWAALVASDKYAPEVVGALAGVAPDDIRTAARLYANGPKSAIYYGLGVTEHSQGSTGVMCLGNLALACGMLGIEGVGVNPLRGQGNVQGQLSGKLAACVQRLSLRHRRRGARELRG